MHSDQGDISPATREVLRHLMDPDVFPALVEYLEPSPVTWLLKLWGVAHGAYPADRVPPLDIDEMKALLTRLQQRPAR
jgi:hypothetical protein